jgi:hypothetical protein
VLFLAVLVKHCWIRSLAALGHQVVSGTVLCKSLLVGFIALYVFLLVMLATLGFSPSVLVKAVIAVV